MPGIFFSMVRAEHAGASPSFPMPPKSAPLPPDALFHTFALCGAYLLPEFPMLYDVFLGFFSDRFLAQAPLAAVKPLDA